MSAPIDTDTDTATATVTRLALLAQRIVTLNRFVLEDIDTLHRMQAKLKLEQLAYDLSRVDRYPCIKYNKASRKFVAKTLISNIYIGNYDTLDEAIQRQLLATAGS